MNRPPTRLRAVAGWMVFGGILGYLGVLSGGLRGKSTATVAADVVVDTVALFGGRAFWRGHRWAYVVALIFFAVTVVEGAIFFGTHDRYSWGTRLAAGLPVIALASLPIVVMLTHRSRAWYSGQGASDRGAASSSRFAAHRQGN